LKFIVFILSWILTACSLSTSSATDQYFTVEMRGTKTTPEDAAGDVTPKWQKYTLAAVSFISEDGTETSSLFGAADGKEYKIIDRDQIIFKKDIADLEGDTFSGVSVGFEEEVTGESENSDDHVFIMEDPNLVLTDSFTVETGKSITLFISVQWKNTVLEETMEEPDFDLTLD
jgi:hypothetical protein